MLGLAITFYSKSAHLNRRSVEVLSVTVIAKYRMITRIGDQVYKFYYQWIVISYKCLSSFKRMLFIFSGYCRKLAEFLRRLKIHLVRFQRLLTEIDMMVGA